VLAKKSGGLRRGLTVAKATDVLLAVYSAEVFQMFRERGWRASELRAWLIEILSARLLGG